MKILLVEDEPGMVRMLERGLGAHGHGVVSAGTGEEALASLSADPPTW